MESFLQGRTEIGEKEHKLQEYGNPVFKEIHESVSEVADDSPMKCKTLTKDENDAKVELISDGSEVRKIIVTCTCGKRTELSCQYD